MSSLKTFSLSTCHWIGFDLDHTLIRYRLTELHTLIYDLMCQYLVDTHEYNSQLLRNPYDKYFGVKALIYDSLYGNLIQLDSNGLVHTALHGIQQRLTSEQIKQIYPNALQDIEEDASKRFLCIFTYFEHCISYLIGHLVDSIDNNRIYALNSTKTIEQDRKYSFFLVDLTAGFDYLFGDFNRGNYFRSIRNNPEKYIYKRPDVRQWLEKLKSANKRLFLATNSRLDYTDLLTKYAFGDDWRDLFDLIIVDCKKPLFFSDPINRIFQRINENDNQFIPVTNNDLIKDFSKNYIYAFGNSRDLHSIMKEISQQEPIVIYFGDHIKSDINALKQHTNWLAGVIVEELEFDSPPSIIHAKTHHFTSNIQTYDQGNRSKYFSSFFTSPLENLIFDNADETEPDIELPSVTSSYWYAYITKHAHFSLSCLSVLANHYDLHHQFEHDENTKHFIVMQQK